MLAAKKYPTDKFPLIMKGTQTYTFGSCRGDMKDNDGTWDLYNAPKHGGYCVAVLLYGTASSTMSISNHPPCLPDSAHPTFVEEFSHLQDDINAMHGDDYFSMSELPTNKRNYRYLSALVPVSHVFSNGKDSAIAILFFVPDDFSERVAQNKKKTDVVTSSPKESAKTIVGIESLRLTNEELKELGIEREGEMGIRYISESLLDKDAMPDNMMIRKQVVSSADTARRIADFRTRLQQRIALLNYKNYDTSARQILYRTSVDLNQSEDRQDTSIIPYGGWSQTNYSQVTPIGYSVVLHTYSFDKRTNSYGTTQYRTSIINENSPLLRGKSKNIFTNTHEGIAVGTGIAIPVRIDMGTVELSKPNSLLAKEGIDTSKYKRIVVQIWFVPTREFVERLPARYRLPLVKELNLYERVLKGEILPQEACSEILNQQSYLGMCGLTNGTLRILSLYPNPATNVAKMMFTSHSSGIATVVLYTADGTFIRNAIQERQYQSGTSTWDIDLENLTPGMYLVTMVSSTGDRSTQRLLVQ